MGVSGGKVGESIESPGAFLSGPVPTPTTTPGCQRYMQHPLQLAYFLQVSRLTGIILSLTPHTYPIYHSFLANWPRTVERLEVLHRALGCAERWIYAVEPWFAPEREGNHPKVRMQEVCSC